jgi:hypothetical protein
MVGERAGILMAIDMAVRDFPVSEIVQPSKANLRGQSKVLAPRSR